MRHAIIAVIIAVVTILAGTPAHSAEKVLVIGNEGEIVRYSVSPDLQHAAFIRSFSNTLTRTIELVPLDGSQSTPLYTKPAGTTLNILGWTDDSRSIIVEDSTTLGVKILRIPIDGASIVVIASNIAFIPCVNFGPCYGPDFLGEASDGALIYQTLRQEGDHFTRQFFRTPRDGDYQSTVQLAGFPDANIRCSLPPNAAFLVCGRNNLLVLINAITPAPPEERILPGELSDRQIITPDHKRLIALVYIPDPVYPPNFSSYLYSIPLEPGGQPIRLSDQPVDTTISLNVTPNGRWVVFSRDRFKADGVYGIYRARLDGGADSAELLVEIPHNPLSLEMTRLVITSDSQHVVYEKTYGGDPHPAIGIYSLALNQPGALPVRLSTLGPDERLQAGVLALAKEDQLVVYEVINLLTDARRIMSVPVIGPPGAALPVRTDELAARLFGTFGSHVFFLSSGPQIYITDLDGVQPPVAAPGLATPLSYSVLPDGRFFLIQPTSANAANYAIADLGVLHGGFTTAALSVAEGDGEVSIPVTLEAAPISTRTITYTVSGGTAGLADITLPIRGTISFESGQRRASLTVPIVGDTLDEGSETLLLRLSSDPESITLDRADFTLTIRDQGSCQAQLPLVVNGS